MSYVWVAVTPWDIARIGNIAVGATKQAALDALRDVCEGMDELMDFVQVTKEYINKDTP